MIATTSLAGCKSIPKPVLDHCVWVKQHRFSEETKRALRSFEWTPDIKRDFENLAKHNDKVREICGH
jgi:hypothetical protein